MTTHNKPGAYNIYLWLSAIAAFGQSTVWTVSGVYQVEVVKLNPLQLVLIGTVLELTIFILQVPTGALADLYSRRLSVVIGHVLLGCSYLVQGVWPRFDIILLSQIVLGAGYTFIIGAQEAWAADELGEEQAGRAFLHAAQWGQIGSLIAVPFSLALANWLQLNTPIIIGGLILMMVGFSLLFWMPEHNFQPRPRGERTTWQMLGRQMVDGGKAVRASSMLWCILSVTLVIGLASEGIDRLSTAHFLQDFTLPSLWGLKPVTWFGIISVGGTLLSLAGTEIVRRSVNTDKPRAVIRGLFIIHIILIASVVTFGLAGNFYLALAAFWCIGVMRAVDTPLHAMWITQNSNARQRATIISFDGMVDPIGQIAGGPLVGAIGTWFSLRAAMIAVSVILSPVLVLFIRALNLSKPDLTSAVQTESEIVETVPEV